MDGGCDLLLPETSFDTLNMKACLFAIGQVFEEKGREIAGDDLRHCVHRRSRLCWASRSKRSTQPSSIFRRSASASTVRWDQSRLSRILKRCRTWQRRMSVAIRTPACRMEWAASTRTPATLQRLCVRRRQQVWSTSSADAAARLPNTFAELPKRSKGLHRERFHRATVGRRTPDSTIWHCGRNRIS